MSKSLRHLTTVTVFLAATVSEQTHAAVVTLNSPDGNWQISSDEFGAYGGGLPGGSAFRNFGTGLTDYSWASSVMVTDGVTRQPLSSNVGAGWGTGAALTAGNVISDSTVGNTRTSVYSVTGFPTLQVTLTQTAANSGISQQYAFSNTGATALNLSVLSFHDVDLDGATWTTDFLKATSAGVSVWEGSRVVNFSPAAVGYQGFLAGFFPGGGVTGNLDTIVWNNFGIPAGFLNEFRDVTGGALGADFDINNDSISDAVADVAYVFQNNITVPGNGSVSLTLGTVPEPSTALLGLLALGCAARRRR
jgi:hypothetical protein